MDYRYKSEGLSVRCVKGEATSLPPEIPTLLEPQSGIQNASIPITLNWTSCEDPDNDNVVYDIYLDNTDVSNIYKENHKSNSLNIYDLSGNRTYYWKIVTKDTHGNEAISETWNFKTKNDLQYGSVTDIEGNVYKTVVIGNQEWMAENLKTMHYADGTPIPIVSETVSWAELFTEGIDSKACCWQDDDSISNHQKGRYYTWPAAMNDTIGSNSNPSGMQGVCPDGWHMPSKSEIDELKNFVNLNSFDGKEATALKSITRWKNNGNGTNEFGFNLHPYGKRYNDGTFQGFTSEGQIWSSMRYVGVSDNLSEHDVFAYTMEIWYNDYDNFEMWDFYYAGTKRYEAVNVRCVKD